MALREQDETFAVTQTLVVIILPAAFLCEIFFSLGSAKLRLDKKQALIASGVAKITAEVPSEVVRLISYERLKLIVT